MSSYNFFLLFNFCFAPALSRLHLYLGQTVCQANFGTKTGQFVQTGVKLSEKEDKNSVTILHAVRHSVTHAVNPDAEATNPMPTESATTDGTGSGAA